MNKQQQFNNLFTLAQRSHQKGDLEMAVNLYRESLKIIKNQPDALHMMGIALSGMGKDEKAIESLVKAVHSSPDNPVFLVNLGEIYLKSKKYQQAHEVLSRAITIKPDFAEAYHKLANALRGLYRYEEAVAFYTKALELNPRHSLALYNLGNTMLATGNYTSAIRYYQESIAINPNYPYAHNNLGIALQEWERLDEAMVHYGIAMQLKPDMEEAIKNAAALFEKQGRNTEARQLYQHLIKINPGNKALQLQVYTSSFVIPSGNDEIDAYRSELLRVLSRYKSTDFTDIRELIEHHACPPAGLIYQGKDDKEVKESFASLFSNIKRVDVNHHNSKPHIGFVVTSGHEGVFIKCMRGILNNLDTAIFDVSVVCSFPNGEKILRPVIENTGVKFLPLPKDFDQALEVVRKAAFDLLHYWEIGTDSINYFLALCKPAKVQCTSWGWPVTSGMKEVDYFISSRYLESEEGQNFYTEKLIEFERLPVYYYPPQVPAQPKKLSSYNLPEDVTIYLCQQNLRKVHPDFDQAVSGILERDPKALVVFIEDKQANITSLLRNRLNKRVGKNSDRISFVKRMEEKEYLGLLAQVSVALDTFHYGGGANTVYDAFEAGVPLITMPGNMHRGRFAYAAYKQMGVEGCVTKNINDYIETAVAVANDPELRKAIVAEITRNKDKIFKDQAAVKELSDFFISAFNSLKL